MAEEICVFLSKKIKDQLGLVLFKKIFLLIGVAKNYIMY